MTGGAYPVIPPNLYFIIMNITAYLIDDANPSRSLLCEARMIVRAARRNGEVLQQPTNNQNARQVRLVDSLKILFFL